MRIIVRRGVNDVMQTVQIMYADPSTGASTTIAIRTEQVVCLDIQPREKVMLVKHDSTRFYEIHNDRLGDTYLSARKVGKVNDAPVRARQ